MFLWMHSALPRREALRHIARQHDWATSEMSRGIQHVSLWMFIKPNQNKTKQKNPHTKTTTITTKDTRSYCFPSIFLPFILYTQGLTWEWKRKELLASLEHWYWVMSDPFPLETPYKTFSVERLKDSRKKKTNKQDFTVQGVCLFIKISFTPNLPGFYW